MALFDRFRETIFLKSDSELEKEIAELKSIREQVKDKEKLDIDIKKLELGLMGERQIEYELKTSDLGIYVLHDITLPYEDLTAQIDYIINTPAATYIVECKNLIGNVTVDNKGEFVREYYINGKHIKESIYSPYRQALRHIELIKKRWLERNGKLSQLLFEKNFSSWYRPLVVFCNPKGILNIKYAPKKIKDHIVKIDQLNEYLKKEYNNTTWDNLSTQKQMLDNSEGFLNANITRVRELKDKYEKIEQENNNESPMEYDIALETRLKEFRTKKSRDRKIPAYYVFNNAELERLVKEKPNTIEKLKDSKILDNTKLKLHGEEIIEIINNDNFTLDNVK